MKSPTLNILVKLNGYDDDDNDDDAQMQTCGIIKRKYTQYIRTYYNKKDKDSINDVLLFTLVCYSHTAIDQ